MISFKQMKIEELTINFKEMTAKGKVGDLFFKFTITDEIVEIFEPYFKEVLR